MGNGEVRRDNFKGIYVDLDKRLAPNVVSIRTGVKGTRVTFEPEFVTDKVLDLRVQLAQKKMVKYGASPYIKPALILMGSEAYSQFTGSAR